MSTDLVRRHLASLGGTPDPSLYTEDLVLTFPYAPRHHTQGIQGRDGYLGFLERVVKFFDGYKVGDSRVMATSDPNVVIAEYPGSATSNETGALYEQNYIAVFTIRDGKIAAIREYYNPIRVLVATGEIEEPGAE